jgi:hypothetical protein
MPKSLEDKLREVIMDELSFYEADPANIQSTIYRILAVLKEDEEHETQERKFVLAQRQNLNDHICVHHNDKERADLVSGCPICRLKSMKKYEHEYFMLKENERPVDKHKICPDCNHELVFQGSPQLVCPNCRYREPHPPADLEKIKTPRTDAFGRKIGQILVADLALPEKAKRLQEELDESCGMIERELVLAQRRVFLPKCELCNQEQTELGAVLFGVPDSDGRCEKIHCCSKCWVRLNVLPENKL